MQESQATICAWADETFGPAASVQRVLGRANEELAELLRKATAGPALDAAAIAEEAADVGIVLCRAARMLGDEELFACHMENDADDEPIAWEIAAMASVYLNGGLYTVRRYPADALGSIQTCFAALTLICSVLGRDLLAEIDRKMAVNRTRAWKRDGTGHGYHVREKGAA
jgi:NTP pyrophosphatase (non-canonical NTP hydrolase)